MSRICPIFGHNLAALSPWDWYISATCTHAHLFSLVPAGLSYVALIGPDWQQIGQLWDQISQRVKMNRKLIFISPIFVPFGANLTPLVQRSDNRRVSSLPVTLTRRNTDGRESGQFIHKSCQIRYLNIIWTYQVLLKSPGQFQFWLQKCNGTDLYKVPDSSHLGLLIIWPNLGPTMKSMVQNMFLFSRFTEFTVKKPRCTGFDAICSELHGFQTFRTNWTMLAPNMTR